MRKPAVVVAVASLLAVLGASGVCSGDDATTQAAQRYREGIAAFKRWDFDAARVSLLQAYALDPEPKYLWNLAITEAKANRPVDALGHFKAYLGLPVATEEDRKKARPLIADAESKTGHLVVVAPANAVVSIDGSEITPFPPDGVIDVTSGRHVVEARLGTNAMSSVAEPGAGDTVRVSLNLVGPPAPPLLAEVQTAPSAATLPPGSAVAPTADSSPARTPASNARWIVAGGLTIAGVASLFTGGVFFANAGSEKATWQGLDAKTGPCPQPPVSSSCIALKDAADARSRDQNLGGVFVGAGAALVVAGIVTWVVWPKSRDARDAMGTGFVAPVVGSGGAGATWVQSF